MTLILWYRHLDLVQKPVISFLNSNFVQTLLNTMTETLGLAGFQFYSV